MSYAFIFDLPLALGSTTVDGGGVISYVGRDDEEFCRNLYDHEINSCMFSCTCADQVALRCAKNMNSFKSHRVGPENPQERFLDKITDRIRQCMCHAYSCACRLCGYVRYMWRVGGP